MGTTSGTAEDADAGAPTQTEIVDVYLLAPEEPGREIELKDFTIMKPKSSKMHRLLRMFPRCEISYRAIAPPPVAATETTVVTSPNGTSRTVVAPVHRHNGGFSNPSRNAEVFRLKRRLLREYFESEDFVPRDAGSDYSPPLQPLRPVQRRLPRPKYRPVPVDDAETIELTSTHKLMDPMARVRYISSLWPEPTPVSDEEDAMDYYELEVEIISEDERQQSEKDLNVATAVEVQGPTSFERVKPAHEDDDGPSTDASSAQEDEPPQPVTTVETRSGALHKLKGDEPLKMSPTASASKQDDWVQCDKCQKWRRLPNHVNVSELPATWFCKMNRWDKRHNKCSVPEEKLVVLMKESDLIEYRERRFVQDFLQRVKRMEKAVQLYKYTDVRTDDGDRKAVQCVECLKMRPLIGGMDPAKIAKPFVCWMNTWDELHASCSAPQRSELPRFIETELDNERTQKGPSSASGSGGGSEVKQENVPDKKANGKAKKPSGNSAKRKVPPTPERSTSSAASGSSIANSAKRTKRR